MRRGRNERGFTLTEAAAAAMIVAVSLIGTVAAVSSGVALSESTAETCAAQRAATDILEEIRCADVDSLVSTYHSTSRAVSAFGSAGGAADIVVRRLDDSSTRWAVYEVVVIVRWARSGTPRTVELRTYVCDRAAGSGLGTQAVVESES